MDDDPEGLEDSMWSYDTNIKDLDDFVGQISGTIQAEREIRSDYCTCVCAFNFVMCHLQISW